MNAELYLECSAKYQENVEDVFREATKRALAFNRKQRNNKRKKKCIILWKFFFFFLRTKSHKNPLLQWDRLCSVSCRDWKLGACTCSFSVTGKWVMTQQERQFCKLQRGAWNTLFWRVLLSYVMSFIFMYFFLPEEFCTVILPKTYLLEAPSYCLYCDVAFTI